MVGAVIIVVVLLVALPAGFWITWGVVAWLLGQILTRHAEATHPGSELIGTNL